VDGLILGAGLDYGLGFGTIHGTPQRPPVSAERDREGECPVLAPLTALTSLAPAAPHFAPRPRLTTSLQPILPSHPA
jgi:hypothetical protein